MTVSDWEKFFSDRRVFPDPGREVDMVFAPDDVSMEMGMKLALRGTVVPSDGEKGANVLVAFHSDPMRKYRFQVRFDADYTIKEVSASKALKKLQDELHGVQVMRFSGRCGGVTSWIPEDGFSRIEIFQGEERGK